MAAAAAPEVPPLPPADGGGGGNAGGAATDHRVPLARRPRNREVSSRYKSAAAPPSRRCPSPSLGRSSTDFSSSQASDSSQIPPPVSTHKRAISAERKRDDPWQQPQCVSSAPSTPAVVDHALRPNGMHGVGGRPRRVTPERKRMSSSNSGTWRLDQAENARPFENLVAKPEFQKWPTMGKSSVCKSIDLTTTTTGVRTTTTSNRQVGVPRGQGDVKCVRRLLDEADLNTTTTTSDRSENERPSAIENSNSQSGQQHETRVSSGQQQQLEQQQQQQQQQQQKTGNIKPSRTARGTEVPARFWQDLNTRLRRLSDVNQLRQSMPEGTEITTATARASRKTKPTSMAYFQNPGMNTPAGNAWNFSASSPARTTQQQPSSPGKANSPCRVFQSPTRGRATPFINGLQPAVRSSSVACMLNFGADTGVKGKKGLSQQEEAQYLRILHNRWLQWRLVNARAEAAMESQKSTAERVLENASVQISDLRTRVTEKRIKFQKAKQEEKVNSMLSSQEKYLDEWEERQQEHSSSLSGTIEALEAGSLRVPISGGAKVDAQALKQILSSAVDAVESLDSSVGNLESNADKTSDIVCELAEIAAQEKAVLQEFGELLDVVSALETEERSLRSYFVQLEEEKKKTT